MIMVPIYAMIKKSEKKKLEKDRRTLEDLQLEHNKAKREVEKLKLAISLYQQRNKNE